MSRLVHRLCAPLVIALLSIGCDDSITIPEATAAPLAADHAPASLTAGAQDRYTFSANGDFAAANWWHGDWDTWTYGYVQVSRLGSGAKADAFLDYVVEECRLVDPEWWEMECELLAAGWGPIPTTDLRGSARSTLTLDTNPAENPRFTVWAGDGGPMRIVWERTPLFMIETAGRRSDRWGSYSSSRNGSEFMASASATGSLGSGSIPADSWSYVGSTRGNVLVTGGW